jgi:hypothetical protein
MIQDLEKWMFVPLVELKSEVPIIEENLDPVLTLDISQKLDPVLTLDSVLKLDASHKLDKESIVKPEPKEHRSFSPKKQDTLFWCAYVANYGEAEYWLIGNKYKNTEISEKQKVIEFIQKNKASFKAAYPKLTNVKIQEIMSELMLDKKTSLKTFMALTVFYKFHAILTHNKTYIEFCPNLDGPTFLFNQSDDGHYSFKSLETKADVDSIKSTHILIDSDPEKPLKAASNYKMEDLKQMAETLGIQLEKKKKTELYDTILNKIKS